MVQMAHTLIETEPARALILAEQRVRAPPSSLRAISMMELPSFFVRSWARSQPTTFASEPAIFFTAARSSCASTSMTEDSA
jgi:hypothetical protein